MVGSERPLCHRVWFRDLPPPPVSGSPALVVSRHRKMPHVEELGGEFRYISIKILL